MRAAIPLLFLIGSAALLLGSNGMHATLLAVRGTLEGFATVEIALFLTAYYVGFMAGCQHTPRVIRDVGHIRAFTAFASLASAAVMSHALVVESWFWVLTRILTGFCFAGLQMIIESWLNDRASNANRGKVLSVYRIADLVAAMAFQAVLPVFDPQSYVPFAMLTILISFALVPVALTRSPAPPVPASHKLEIARIWQVSPTAVVGAGLIGLSVSSYWAMAPVYVASLGFPPQDAGLFLGAVIFGGAVAQFPVGALSDRMDRRYVIVIVSALAAVTASFVPVLVGMTDRSLLLAGALFGAAAVPSFGLVIAHANDHAETGASVAVNGGLLLVYGSTACFGPVIASQLMDALGSDALFVWIASAHATLGVFGMLRLIQSPAVEPREDYVPVLRTQPGIFELDPRVDPAEEEPEPDAERA